MRQGLRVCVVACHCNYEDQDEAHRRAKELAAAGVTHSMKFYDLPGECDKQRADRLTGELSDAKGEIRRLEAAAKPKRKRAKKPKERG